VARLFPNIHLGAGYKFPIEISFQTTAGGWRKRRGWGGHPSKLPQDVCRRH